MKLSTRFRPYEPQNLTETVRVWVESWRSTGVAMVATTTEAELRERLTREITLGWNVTVAEEDGQIIAFLATKPFESVLDQLFVSPEAQGRGVGLHLLQLASKEMPNGFTLRTAADNDRARRFYEACGLTQERFEPHPVHGHLTVIYRRA